MRVAKVVFCFGSFFCCFKLLYVVSVVSFV